MNTLSSYRVKGEWDKKKAETLKNVFQIILQSQQRFHQQAMNIISACLD